MDNYGDIIIYQTEDGSTKLEVKMENETVWLTQAQLVELFQSSKANVSEHITHIFDEGELDRELVVRKFRTTASDGKNYNVLYYNLDMIISLGYRINSSTATRFRQWATQRLKEYIIKGFAIDDERLKGNGGGNYWKELLDRIRDIRSSEKVLYRQVLDLYATSVDYNPQSEESIKFFKIVQNKLHYAAHGHTAAEVIYERADAEKPFMGLTSFSGELPAIKDIGVAKNYLKEDELKILNNLVSGYFDLAEINAIEHKPMYMSDYVEQLDSVLSSGNRKLLSGSGSISHDQAMKKAKDEYRKYQEITLSPVEEEYLKSIQGVEKEVKKHVRKPTKRDDKELSEEIRDMVLPKELKEFVGTQELIDRSGHSTAKVFETGRGYFIKCDEPGELAREHQMTKVFHQLGFGPEAIKLITLDRDYLVTRKVHGEDLTENLQDPLQLCRLLADALRFLHSQPVALQPNNEIPISSRYTRYMESAAGDISGGYYDPSVCLDRYGTFSKEEAWDVMQQSKDLLRCDTLIHGDACLPNIIQQNGAFFSFIDLSMSGIGDRHIDLYWALWSLRYNLKTEAYSETFLDYYGRDNFSEEMFRVIAAFEVFG